MLGNAQAAHFFRRTRELVIVAVGGLLETREHAASMIVMNHERVASLDSVENMLVKRTL